MPPLRRAARLPSADAGCRTRSDVNERRGIAASGDNRPTLSTGASGRYGGMSGTPGSARSPTIERPADAGTIEDGCALDDAGHPLARVGLCFPSDPALPFRYRRSCRRPRPTPERVPKLGRGSGGAQGEAGGSVSPGTLPAADVGAMPTWHRNRLGVGRVARRARLVTKPFSRPLPRLTLKAGHKEGLPTIPTTGGPIAACGAMRPSVRAVPLFK